MVTNRISSRLVWYARRLSAMSGAEIRHRVIELSRKQSARLARPGWDRFAVPDGPLPIFPVAIDLSSAGEDLLAQWQRMADAAIARRHRFLGVDWPDAGAASIWHFDPVSKEEWPKDQYCFAINYRHSDTRGDVKYVWEINRLSYLQPVAALAARTGRKDLRDFVVREISDWISANPPFLGINWPSGIELSLRAISVLIATRLLGEDAFSDDQRAAIRAFFVATGAWLYRYPSRFSSANNHLIAEAVGLFLIGAACPDQPMSEEWQAYGRRVLEEEADRQFHADGIGAEQSPTYTAFTLELYLTAARVAAGLGRPLPDAVLGKLGGAGEALSWFMDEHGEAPRIGDDDEGRVIVSDPDVDRRYVASVLSAVAATCDRPGIAPPISPPHLRNLIFGARVAETQPLGARSFAEGGYTILRDRVHGKQLIACMDHGPLGFLSIAAHGHADTLAVWLTYGGKAMLADAGTYLYHSGGAWRDGFRGTALHNTLTIDGLNSSQMSGAFNWKTHARAEHLCVDEAVNSFQCAAEHDGYMSRFGVRHLRSFRRVTDDTFAIADRLEGAGATMLNVNISFLAGEGVEISQAAEPGVFDFVADGTSMMRLTPPSGLSARLVRGSEHELLGWRSECFGVKSPAAQLVLSGAVKPGATMETELKLL